LGTSATNVLNELLGRFFGERATKPRALSTRKMVEIDGGAVTLRQVEVDGGGPGMDSVVSERLVHRDDLVLVDVGDPDRGPVRPPGAWLEAGGSLEAVVPEQLEEPARAHVMGGRQFLYRSPGP
jgi:hypothetical protein